MADSDVNVLHLINQWLARIESKLDTLTGKVDGKADRTELAALAQRVTHESDRIDGLQREVEHQTRNKQETSEWRRYLVPMILTVVLVALGVVQLVVH